LAFFTEVVKRTAKLVAHWQCVGFCHGVLNTDNMSILGLTIDYGPFGFMDRFDPEFICNASDDGGRYTYAKQPAICKWNLKKLAEALDEAVPAQETKAIVDEVYDDAFQQHYGKLITGKLGFLASDVADAGLVETLLDVMHKTGADFTNTFRILGELPYPGDETAFSAAKAEVRRKLMDQCCSVEELKKGLKPLMEPRQFQMLLMMAQNQPMFLAMLGMEGKLKAEIDRREKLEQMDDLTSEEKRQKDEELWTDWLNQYQEKLEEDFKKVSDRLNTKDANAERLKVTTSSNPRFILRNWVAQTAISKAEEGDFGEVRNVLDLLQRPFDGQATLQQPSSAAAVTDETPVAEPPPTVGRFQSCGGLAYDGRPPEWSEELRVT